MDIKIISEQTKRVLKCITDLAPSIHFPSLFIPLLCSCPNFLDELARKRLLRRLYKNRKNRKSMSQLNE